MVRVSEIISRSFDTTGAGAAKRMHDLDVGMLPVEQNADVAYASGSRMKGKAKAHDVRSAVP